MESDGLDGEFDDVVGCFIALFATKFPEDFVGALCLKP